MSLSSDPSVTYNTRGNVLNAATITNGTPNAGNICDFSTNTIGGWITIYCSPGTASAVNGIVVQIYAQGDTGGDYDTVVLAGGTIAQTTSTISQQSWLVPTGKYSVTVSNLDATHTVAVSITSNPIA